MTMTKQDISCCKDDDPETFEVNTQYLIFLFSFLFSFSSKNSKKHVKKIYYNKIV